MLNSFKSAQIVLRVTALFFTDPKSNFEKGSRKDAKFCEKSNKWEISRKKENFSLFSTNGMRKNAKTFAKKCDIDEKQFFKFRWKP